MDEHPEVENVEKAEKPAPKKKKAAPKPVEVKVEPVIEEVVEEVAEVKPPAPPISRQPVEQEPSWDINTWYEVCQVRIGVLPFVLVGAFKGQDPERKYTEGEIRSLVQNFLNKPVR